MTARLMLLAIFGSQRKPRLVPPEEHDYARAWARRWWSVEALTVAEARDVIRFEERYAEALRQSPQNRELLEQWRPAGRIVDMGRHGPGGPTATDRLLRATSGGRRGRGAVEGSGER